MDASTNRIAESESEANALKCESRSGSTSRVDTQDELDTTQVATRG